MFSFNKKAAVAIASLTLLFGAAPTVASEVILPPANEMTVGVYGDFNVYSLDLLGQCQAAGDPRCQPYVGDATTGNPPQQRVQSSPGQIADQLIIYQGGSSTNNYPPCNSGTPLCDNPFDTGGGSPTTYDFAAAGEPDPTFTGDQDGTWEVTLAELAAYLGLGTNDPSNLVFLFDNNQQGTTAADWLYIWATAAVLDASGNLVGGQCYALFANNYDPDSCDPANQNPVVPTFGANGFNTNPNDTNYVAVVGDFCVDATTGVAYNIGTASNAGACVTGDYFIQNNLGQNDAEFAAYQAALEAFIFANYVAHPDWVLSVNVRLANMNDGPEQLWICSDCTLPDITVPEPGTVALLGMSLAVLAFVIRRRRNV